MAEGLGNLVEGFVRGQQLQMEQAQQITQKQLQQSHLELQRQEAQQRLAEANTQASNEAARQALTAKSQAETERHNKETEGTSKIKVLNDAERAAARSAYEAGRNVLNGRRLDQIDSRTAGDLFEKNLALAMATEPDRAKAYELARTITDDVLARTRINPQIEIDPAQTASLLKNLSSLGPNPKMTADIQAKNAATEKTKVLTAKEKALNKLIPLKKELMEADIQLKKAETLLYGGRNTELTERIKQDRLMNPQRFEEIKARLALIQEQTGRISEDRRNDRAARVLLVPERMADPVFVAANHQSYVDQRAKISTQIQKNLSMVKEMNDVLSAAKSNVENPPMDWEQNPPVPLEESSDKYKYWADAVRKYNPDLGPMSPTNLDGIYTQMLATALNNLQVNTDERALLYKQAKGIDEALKRAGLTTITKRNGGPTSVIPAAPTNIRPGTTAIPKLNQAPRKSRGTPAAPAGKKAPSKSTEHTSRSGNKFQFTPK
jgi:hypothetical protein